MKRRCGALRARDLLLSLLIAAPLLADEPAAEAPRVEAQVDVEARLRDLATKYRVKMVHEAPRFPVQLHDGQIRGRAADKEKLAGYLPIFAKEFARYPVEFVKRSGLRRVVFCEELAWDDQLRAAIPHFADRTLYLDVARGAEDERYQRRVLHHEFFHIVDEVDDGLLYRDDRWSAANPEGFRYGAGGHAAQTTAETGTLSDKYPGFLNHYSTTGVEEDKAEIFAHLYLDPAELARRAETDAVLHVKVELMKRLLEEFCPEMERRRPPFEQLTRRRQFETLRENDVVSAFGQLRGSSVVSVFKSSSVPRIAT